MCCSITIHTNTTNITTVNIEDTSTTNRLLVKIEVTSRLIHMLFFDDGAFLVEVVSVLTSTSNFNILHIKL